MHLKKMASKNVVPGVRLSTAATNVADVTAKLSKSIFWATAPLIIATECH